MDTKTKYFTVYNMKYAMELKNRNEKIDFYHCILLATDKIGFTMLKELSSRAWSRSFFYFFYVSGCSRDLGIKNN